MSKSLLIEELSRLHEIMGIKKNITNIIVEAIGGGGKPRGSFDFNSGVKSALKQELEDSVTNWAANTARLTKKGGRATFDDLLEQGRILAKNTNIDDATALYYLARATGPESYRSLMESLSIVNRRAFNAEVNLIANTGIQKQIKDGINTLFYKFDWKTVDVNTLQDVKNALGMISDDIDKTSINSSIKSDLKSFLKEQEQIMDDAMEIQSIPPATLSKNTDIDINTNPKPNTNIGGDSGDVEAAWNRIKTDAEVKLGKSINDADPTIQNIKKLIGERTEKQLSESLGTYMENLKTQVNDKSLSRANRREAQEKLTNILQTVKTVNTSLGSGLEQTVKRGGNILSFLGKNWGKITLGTIFLGLALNLPDVLEILADVADLTPINARPDYNCWEEIPGFEQYLDQYWWPGGTGLLRDFILGEFRSDELKEYVCNGNIRSVFYGGIKTGQYAGGIAITFEHLNGCKDVFEINKDQNSTRWRDNKRCNTTVTPEETNPESTPPVVTPPEETKTTECTRTEEEFLNALKSVPGLSEGASWNSETCIGTDGEGNTYGETDF